MKIVIPGGSGQVGTGSKIRVRGTSSFDLAQAPLVYIDGVRTDNDQATGPANQAFSSSSVSIMSSRMRTCRLRSASTTTPSKPKRHAWKRL